MTRFTAHFTPEAWIKDNATEVDAEGPQEWDCTEFAYANYGYTLRVIEGAGFGIAGIDNDDVFKSDPAAPQWVRDWKGPFTITVRAEGS
jgi:hypothetical protein